jgi:hypothetical protein
MWSYHHGDNRAYRGGPPAFWEVLEESAVTGTVLQVLTEELDGGKVIYRSYSATDRFSVSRNSHQLFWKSAPFLARKLRHLRDDADSALLDPEAPEGQPTAYSSRLYLTPHNLELAPHLMRLARRYLGQRIRSTFEDERWFMAYARRKEEAGSREPELAPFRFRLLMPPDDAFWADPFPVRHADRDFILFEEYSYAARKGHISVLELGKDGKVSAPVRVLERDYHLSYPFVFSWRGEWYMLPETAASKRVELYRARLFPFEWEPAATLMRDVVLQDCTLAEIEGTWWMFSCARAHGSSASDELHVFWAETPLGPWNQHPRNPVMADVRRARPAGSLFSVGGHWYRPSQDCSRGYGWAINLNRITRLDRKGYSEEVVTTLKPHWMAGLRGTHTLNAAGGLTVIDGRLRRFVAPWNRRAPV